MWPVVGIVGSIVGGAAFGFFSPIMETFQAVGEGKTDQLYHCFYVCLQFSCCLIIILFLFLAARSVLVASVTEIHPSQHFSGWNLEHCQRVLHYCEGYQRCMLLHLLLNYG